MRTSMPLLRRLAAMAFALVAASAAQATPQLLALAGFNEGPGRLISIDPVTGAGALLAEISGGPGNGLWTGLAASGSELVAVSGFDNELYSVSFAGAVSSIGPSGIDDREGYLEFSPSGTLYSGTADRLYTVDPMTGAASLVGTTGLDDPNGLAFSPLGNALVLDGFANGSGVSLFGLDVLTGDTTLIGDLGLVQTNGVGGLTFFGSKLLAVVDDSLYRVDPETGAATLIGATGFTGVSSLVAIPEPATALLMAPGLLWLALASRRAHR